MYSDSLLISELMVRLILLRSFRMSFHSNEIVSCLFFKNEWDIDAFHISSLVFMDDCEYPRREFIAISVLRVVPHGALMLSSVPYEKLHVLNLLSVITLFWEWL